MDLVTLNSFFDPFFNRIPHSLEEGKLPLSVVELEDKYKIQVEVPGVPRDKIDITTDKESLTISIEKKLEDLPTLIQERVSGSLNRTLYFHHKVDVDSVGANLIDGILTVTLNKFKKDLPRKVMIT